MKLRHYLLLGLAGSLVIGVALGAFVLVRTSHFARPSGLAGRIIPICRFSGIAPAGCPDKLVTNRSFDET